MFRQTKLNCLSLLFGLTLAGCTPSHDTRIESANIIASGAHFQVVRFQTPNYAIAGWQASNLPSNTMRIYIEGDGFAWRTPSQPSADPTPIRPTMLELAAEDGAPNVIYLARPCQYIRTSACRTALWTSDRFSSEVLASYQSVLDQLRQTRGAKHFELVGFSGGGVIAALLATTRNDIRNLRTVSTPIDIRIWAKTKKFSQLHGSLNPADFLEPLSRLPQIHFWGGKDTVVPLSVIENYQDRLPENGRCSAIHQEPANTHDQGWRSEWRHLLTLIPQCKHLVASNVANQQQ